jgi:hypothetical protein
MTIASSLAKNFVKVSSCLGKGRSLGTEATTPSALVPVFSVLDVTPQGVAGVSGTVERHGAERLKATTTSGELKQRSTGSWPSQEECIRMPLASGATISASPADSFKSGGAA